MTTFTDTELDTITDVLKALGHEVRLKLMRTLLENGEKSVGELEAITGIGQAPMLLNEFLPHVLQGNHAPRAFSFGMGLAEAATSPLDLWGVLRDALITVPIEHRNTTVLGGFLYKTCTLNPSLGAEILDDLLSDPEMVLHFVYLQAQAGIDGVAIERLRNAIRAGRVDARQFYALASGVAGSRAT